MRDFTHGAWCLRTVSNLILHFDRWFIQSRSKLCWEVSPANSPASPRLQLTTSTHLSTTVNSLLSCLNIPEAGFHLNRFRWLPRGASLTKYHTQLSKSNLPPSIQPFHQDPKTRNHRLKETAPRLWGVKSHPLYFWQQKAISYSLSLRSQHSFQVLSFCSIFHLKRV